MVTCSKSFKNFNRVKLIHFLNSINTSIDQDFKFTTKDTIIIYLSKLQFKKCRKYICYLVIRVKYFMSSKCFEASLRHSVVVLFFFAIYITGKCALLPTRPYLARSVSMYIILHSMSFQITSQQIILFSISNYQLIVYTVSRLTI